MIKKIFNLEGLDCGSCCMMIDDCLEEIPGVVSSKTSYAKQVCEVEFDEDKISEEDVISAVENSGYAVTSF